jgi:prepilin-type N-terminal cleavage/methylation domain-containing protein
MHTVRRTNGFTLIELLIVIAIVAILAVAVILTLNPVELIRQSRDSTRLSDMETLNKALALYSADNTAGATGNAQTVYVSLPDSTATTTNLGTDCVTLGLPPLPTGWTYHCSSPAALTNVDSTGWIPVDFRQTSFSSILGRLPVDPINSISSGHYYTYQKGSWELTAVMESQKYTSGGANDVASNDQGNFKDLYEVGSDLTLLPVDRVALALSTSTPQVSMTAPTASTTVSGTSTVLAATATDTVGIASVQFLLDGANLGSPIATPPYQGTWDTTLTGNGGHALSAIATNNASRSATSPAISVTVNNVSSSLPTLVQFTVTSNAPAATCSAQLNSPVVANHLLVLTVDTNSSTAALSVSDNLGNTWQTANSNTSAFGTQHIFYTANAASGVTNVTATLTNWGDALRSCEFAEYSGVTTYDTGSVLTGAGTQLKSGTSTTNFASELVIGAGSVPNCSSCTPAPNPGFIIVSASAKSFQEYKVLSAVSTLSAGVGMSSSSQWLMNMATFH